MAELGMSTAELVNNAKPVRMTQYIAALSATMGAFCFGTALGYSSPAGILLTTNSTDSSLQLSPTENSWFSSSVNLGALVGGPIGGLCINAIGRRGTMLASFPFYLGSWAIIAFAQNFAMLLAGRIIVGLCTGITCIAAPTYIGEFASADIRGMLGSGFQLMVVFGILYAYVFGAFINSWQILAVICAVPTILYCVLMVFSKESPSYLLFKGKEKEAKEALQHFRGRDYNIQPEMQMLKQSLEDSKESKTSFSDLKQSYILKPLLIALALMFFQQLSGVNAVLFNLKTIFADSGTDLSDDVSSIIIGVVQVLATAVASVLMDKAGRKILLIISSAAMTVSLVSLGVFFYLKDNGDVSALGWLPITSLIIFIASFSIGYGPIPWLMMGELFSANVREAAGSLSTMANWSISFIVTLLFEPLQDAIHEYGVYWIFGGVCAINLVFCVLVVPETKGKTLQEITALFGGPVTSPPARASSPSSASEKQRW
ncbi:facilitated trehalose transporter Tret1-like [Penaeus japonicus]|uniref:facilitated trehalose transporter Tret1-like n=1 Tax=Penaeus japonicus TaxID=27405 RepID=UPI001C7165D4|nr:facilitated trehalose transporter Tret1-like [Penaeus japonicus]